MRVALAQLDGKLPNIALMRLSAYHKSRGDEVDYLFGAQFEALAYKPDVIYGSAIFRKSIPLAERFRQLHPNGILGGTGVDPARKNELVPLSPAINSEVLTLEKLGIKQGEGRDDLDYSAFPNYTASIGFTQRGCRKKCSFCVVPSKEPELKGIQSVYEIWRGKAYPKHLHLLDNDFFGQPEWEERLNEIRSGGFKVSFNQGINARFLTDETARAIASVDYRSDDMKVKRIYTAWDNLPDEDMLFAGLEKLKKYGVKPDHIMVYVLCGYWPYDQDFPTWDHRRRRLREFGARPYPMPFVRSKKLVGFQRWVIGAYDKRFPWEIWEANNYRPEGIEKHLKGKIVNTSFKPSTFDKQAAASLDMIDEEAARERVEAILGKQAGPTLTPAPQTQPQAPATKLEASKSKLDPLGSFPIQKPRKPRSDKGTHKPKAPADPDEIVLRLTLQDARECALGDVDHILAAKIQDQIIAQLQRKLDALQKQK